MFLELKMEEIVFLMAFWSILRTFGIVYGYLVYLLVIWYILPRFGKYYGEKSGNPQFEPCAFLSSAFIS
jgi:hypothetical protein